ncbi:MAG: transposase [Ignavibacteriales bacterium]|nr:transposase [Ignavibacteriales bacterium]
MSHSFTKIWIHAVFGTKDRVPIISSSFENQLYSHIQKQLEADFECFVKVINGTENHIHI